MFGLVLVSDGQNEGPLNNGSDIYCSACFPPRSAKGVASVVLHRRRSLWLLCERLCVYVHVHSKYAHYIVFFNCTAIRSINGCISSGGAKLFSPLRHPTQVDFHRAKAQDTRFVIKD